MGHQPTFREIHTPNMEVDRLQKQLREIFGPVLANPLFGAADFRWMEIAGAAGATPTFALQYRTPGTQAWTTIGTFSGSGHWSGDCLSVKDFGAKGDGSADDTAAIQAAINAAGNGTVVMPTGTYLVSSSLVISSRMSLIGYGWGAPGFTGGTPGTVIRRIADVIVFKIQAAGSVLQDVYITASAAGTTDGITVGEADSTDGAGRVTLRNVVVTAIGGNGVNIQNGNAVRIDGLMVTSNGGHGLAIDSKWTGGVDSNTNACVVTGLHAVGNTGDGLHLGLATSNRILGFHSEGNTGWGVYIASTFNDLSGYVEGNTAGPLKTDTNAFGNHIVLRNVNADITTTNASNWVFLQGGISDVDKTPYLGRRGRMQVQGSFADSYQTVNWNPPTLVISEATGSTAVIKATSGAAFTVPVPTGNPTLGQFIRVWLINNSGGAMGAATWGAGYVFAGGAAPANPASGTSVLIAVMYIGGGQWAEAWRSTGGPAF